MLKIYCWAPISLNSFSNWKGLSCCQCRRDKVYDRIYLTPPLHSNKLCHLSMYLLVYHTVYPYNTQYEEKKAIFVRKPQKTTLTTLLSLWHSHTSSIAKIKQMMVNRAIFNRNKKYVCSLWLCFHSHHYVPFLLKLCKYNQIYQNYKWPGNIFIVVVVVGVCSHSPSHHSDRQSK